MDCALVPMSVTVVATPAGSAAKLDAVKADNAQTRANFETKDFLVCICKSLKKIKPAQ